MPIVNFERYCEMLDKAHAGQHGIPRHQYLEHGYAQCGH